MFAQFQQAQTSGRFRTSLCPYVAPLMIGLITAGFVLPSGEIVAQTQIKPRCVVLELYHKGEDDACKAAKAARWVNEAVQELQFVIRREIWAASCSGCGI